MTGGPIYLDYQATTPVDGRVVDAMLPYWTGKYGNPHSSTHRFGWEAEAGVDRARRQVAALINAQAEEIVFTSGATESNNLAIKGVAEAFWGRKDHFVTVQTEHKCVLAAMEWIEARGGSVTYLPVDRDGLIDLTGLEKALTDRTALVSIMLVNNEIGVIQPMAEIAQICRSHGVLLHCDAAQGFGKVPIDLADQSIDLLSISGHKIYGPKGIGALYVRQDTPLVAQMSGGGQEGGLRSGTVAAPLAVGLGEAARIAQAEMSDEAERLASLMASFQARLIDALPHMVVNGDRKRRWAGNLNVSFPGVDPVLLLSNLRPLAVSSGAACASAIDGPSYVLQALGLDDELVARAIRFGIGRFTTTEEIDRAAHIVIKAADRLSHRGTRAVG